MGLGGGGGGGEPPRRPPPKTPPPLLFRSPIALYPFSISPSRNVVAYLAKRFETSVASWPSTSMVQPRPVTSPRSRRTEEYVKPCVCFKPSEGCETVVFAVQTQP